MRKLSPELISLVHHVKLYESGWWDEALQRLIITIVWVSPQQITSNEIKTELKNTFDIHIESDRLANQLKLMVASKDLNLVDDKKYSVSEKCKETFEHDLNQYEDIEKYAKSRFSEALAKHDPSLSGDDVWQSFHEKCLYPLIDSMGAKFFDLISSNSSIQEDHAFFDFTKCYTGNIGAAIKASVIEFINPNDIKIRSYILRQLNASFYVKAGNLKESDIQKLRDLKDKKVQLNLFIDTNFLFSILDLHDNPANDAAQELMDVIKKIKKSMSVNLYISPETAEEAKQVINFHSSQLKYFRCSKRLVNAALKRPDLNGFTIKYFERCANSDALIDPDEYFDPYIRNLVATIRPRGIELYNDKSFESYGTRQDVVDDILMELEYEKKHRSDDPKTYELLRHDIVLWHFIKDQRPAYIESPLDCQHWIVTVDFRFIGFDSFKIKKTSGIPICVYPTTLIQILQLWVPRSQEFESAIIKSFKLPFLIGDFDANSEKTTIGILKILSRYENIDDLDESTITSILINDALRKKFGETNSVDRQSELVREAILVEYKTIKEKMASAQEKATALSSTIDEKTDEIDKLQKILKDQNVQSQAQANKLSGQVDALITERDDLKNELNGVRSDIKNLIDARQSDELMGRRRKQFIKYFFIFPAGIIFLSAISSAAICYFWKLNNMFFWGLTVFLPLISIYILLANAIAQKNSDIARYGPFTFLEKFHRWFFVTVIGGLLLAWLLKYYQLN